MQENIESASYTRFLLEEAGYLVDWRPAITPELLRTESLGDAILFDFHCLDREELAGQRLMLEHPRWRAVPSLVAAVVCDRKTRLLLRSLGADEVIPKPFSAQELVIRLQALFRTAAPALPLPACKTGYAERPAFLCESAQFAASHTSPEAMEATMLQLLRSLRRTMAFDVGYVCAEGAPNRYGIVAHVGDATCNNARWYVHERFRLEQKLAVTELSRHLLRQLAAQAWPGNVRELKNTIERAILLSDGVILLSPQRSRTALVRWHSAWTLC